MRTAITLCATVALFAALAASRHLPARGSREPRPHKCVHDTPMVQKLMRADLARNRPKMAAIESKLAARRFTSQQSVTGELRIVFSTADLDDSSQYCTAEGDVRPDFAGNSVTCSADDVLTAEKKRILLDNILPTAQQKIQTALQLQQRVSPVVVPQQACGSDFTIPSEHSTAGVSDADVVLYVAAGPTEDGVLAWAGACATDLSNRVVVSRLNFGPANIEWGVDSVNTEQVATAVHETFHALGFSVGFFENSGYTSTATLREKTVTLLTSPTVVDKYREYFGCDTLAGAELEDEGGSGSAGSHFDRRVLPTEMMTGSGGNILSVLTLAALQDTGHYTAVFSNAESMVFAQNAGCGFHESKCNTAAGGAGTYWCFDDDSTAWRCSDDLKKVGFCDVTTYSSDLPTYFQYYSDPRKGGRLFFDGCPWVSNFANRICTDSRDSTANEALEGHYFGQGGRCFRTHGVRDGNYLFDPGTHTCLLARCSDDDATLYVTINGSSLWKTCPSGGGNVTDLPNEFVGSIECPSAASMCPGLEESTPVPPTPPTPVPTPIPPTPVPTPQQTFPGDTPVPGGDTPIPATPSGLTATVTGAFVLSGANWGSMSSDQDAVSQLVYALRSDVGELLAIGAEYVEISSLQVGSLHVTYAVYHENSNRETVNRAFQVAIDGGGVSWMGRVAAVYAIHTDGSDTTALTSATTDEPAAEDTSTPLCSDPSNFQHDQCGIIIIVVIVVVGVICFCAFIAWWNKKHDEEEAAKQREAGAAAENGPGGPPMPGDGLQAASPAGVAPNRSGYPAPSAPPAHQQQWQQAPPPPAHQQQWQQAPPPPGQQQQWQPYAANRQPPRRQ